MYLILLLVLFILTDVTQIVRWIICEIYSRLFHRKRLITDVTNFYGICTLQDTGISFTQMSHYRFVRELDIARSNFYCLTGIYSALRSQSCVFIYQGATSVKYFAAVPIFSPYKIETRLVWWNERNIFIEERLITLIDQRVRAIVMSIQRVIGCNVVNVMTEHFGVPIPPSASDEFTLWIRSNEISSKKLGAASYNISY